MTESDRTLSELERAREAAEDDFLEHVQELEQRVQGLQEAARAAAAAAKAAEAAVGTAEATPVQTVPEPTTDDTAPRLPAIEQQPWPQGRGALRGLLNRLARWWLRDYLATLDARHESVAGAVVAAVAATEARVRAVVEGHARLQRSVAELSEQMARLRRDMPRRDEHRAATEPLREALNRATEAIDMVAGVSLRMRTMVNAMSAETTRRLTGSADAKLELSLDVLARRQEALLAELVGRRAELDELLAEQRS